MQPRPSFHPLPDLPLVDFPRNLGFIGSNDQAEQIIQPERGIYPPVISLPSHPHRCRRSRPGVDCILQALVRLNLIPKMTGIP